MRSAAQLFKDIFKAFLERYRFELPEIIKQKEPA